MSKAARLAYRPTGALRASAVRGPLVVVLKALVSRDGARGVTTLTGA